MARDAGFVDLQWVYPAETGFYQPILLARRPTQEEVAEAGPQTELDAGAVPLDTPPVIRHQFYPDDLGENPFEEAPGFKRDTLVQTRTPDGQVIVSRRKQITLVMFSGGIDSVYVLYRLLKESDDEIVAHHIHFVNIERRHEAEARACRVVVDYLKKTVRDFIYTESAIDRSRFRAFGMDDMAVGFEVGIVHSSLIVDRGIGFDRWTSGTCLEEELEYFGASEIERFENVLNCVQGSCYPNPAPRFFQLKIIPKKAQMDYMGQALVDLCWTCRTPVWAEDGSASECGTCKTCVLMGKIRRGEQTIAQR